MRILITGGTGYIGRHLIPNLKNSHRLFLLSRKKSNPYEKNINMIAADLRNEQQLAKKISKMRFDLIIHLGAFNPKNPTDSEIESYRSNLVGTRNLISLAGDMGVRQIIFASTFSVYGQGAQYLIDESFVPEPINSYSLSKLFAEKFLAQYFNEAGINTTILRISGIFGNDRKDGAIYNFIICALKGEALEVSTPFNTTDMVWVDDVVESILNSFGLEGFNVINIGSGESLRVYDLANLIVGLTKSSSKIKINPQDPHEALSIVLNVDNAKRLLGFNPRGIGSSIKEMLNFYK